MSLKANAKGFKSVLQSSLDFSASATAYFLRLLLFSVQGFQGRQAEVQMRAMLTNHGELLGNVRLSSLVEAEGQSTLSGRDDEETN